MDGITWLLLLAGLVLLGWLLWMLGRRLRRMGGGDRVLGLVKLITWIPLRFYWRARYVGFEKIPDPPFKSGLIVVSNHCSGLDPALIECGVDFRIRWLMWRAMMVGCLGFLWRRMGVIPVDLSSADRSAVRESISWLRSGGAIGIFPEGGIERPGRHIMPFQPGVGFLIAKTRAPVLLIHVSGVPETKQAYSAFFRPCRARIEVVDVIEYPDERDPRTITEDLHHRLLAASGWPAHEGAGTEAKEASSVVPSTRE